MSMIKGGSFYFSREAVFANGLGFFFRIRHHSIVKMEDLLSTGSIPIGSIIEEATEYSNLVRQFLQTL